MRVSVEEQFPDPLIPQLSYELTGLSDWATIVSAVFVLLAQLVATDEVVWNGVDRLTHRSLVFSSTRAYDDRAVQMLLDLDDHPVVNHYLRSRPDAALSPVRLGDLVSDREFRATRTWAELFGPRGVTRQLTVPTGFNVGQTAGTAWSLNRSGSDFTEDDVLQMARLAPLLQALELSADWTSRPDDTWTLPAGTPWAMRGQLALQREQALGSLTPRELEVLELVAAGLTATAIGHRLRISARTVRKHLEHVYAKTGQHDRLMAVGHVRRLGLLPGDAHGG
jgi:DNA-binding CsgD family transcriptional regulator